MVGALGVSNDTRVVFYDQHGLRGSPRGWWMMRLFGHDKVAVGDLFLFHDVRGRVQGRT